MNVTDLKILSVGDQQDNRTELQAVLAEHLPGARVLFALDGPRGLELARSQDPDVILLDIVMPGMDGYEVCRQLKADERLQAIPVLFLTALRSDLSSRIAALDAGAAGFLSKPFDVIELVAQVRAMAKIKAANRQRRVEKDDLAALVTQRTCQLVQELTERRQTETLLRESEQKFAKAFQTAPYAMSITRAEDGKFLEVNDAFTSITGVTRAEALADSSIGLSLWVEEEDRRRVVEELRAGHAVLGREIAFRTRAGGIITTLVSAVVIELKGTPCILSSFIDITERKRSEADRERFHAENIRLEDQLRQSQKMDAIGRLAGGVAHDFNNLTAVVLGYGELLLGKIGPDDPSRKWVEQIVAAGQRSANLTRQLLTFSRKQTLQPVVLDLDALLLDFEKMLTRLIGEDVTVDLRLASSAHRVLADPGQIEQVVTNLALNARDAMPRGGRLTIETAAVELDQLYALAHQSVVAGQYVLLSLTDTGCGMDKTTMARLFEPFFTTKEKGKGTGLGLATVYGVVRQSGGYIWAYSEPGRGTTFKIYLPRTEAKLDERPRLAVEEVPRGNGEMILLVEDEASLRELCETVLTNLGYRVSVADSGAAALHLVREQGLQFDLIVTDVVMPGMGGQDLAERLVRERPGIKVLYMSGYPDRMIAPHGVLGPDIPFLEKPFAERSLATKVREALDGKPAAGRPPRHVLMIDDDEQYRELMRHYCLKRGLDFAGTESAETALAALAAQPFDVLLVDLNIPGTSGEQILRKIRATGHTAPAIVLTGDVASADLGTLRPLGVRMVLEKSGDAGPLLQAIEEVGKTNKFT